MNEELVTLARTLCHPMEPIRPRGVAARLPLLSGIRAVLFDVYGTLFVSGSGEVGAAAAAAASSREGLLEALAWLEIEGDLRAAAERGVGLYEETIRQRHRMEHERGVDFPEVDVRDIWAAVVETLVNEKCLAGPLDQEAVLKLALVYECRTNPVWPMPGMERLVRSLRERGFVLGIVSNAQFYTPVVFQALLGGSPSVMGFPDAYCAWSYLLGLAKPSPRIFREVLEPLRRMAGIEAEETLFVGNDMLNDVMPASRLGCKTAFFAGDQRSMRAREEDARCRGVRPDLTLTELSQLLAALHVQ